MMLLYMNTKEIDMSTINEQAENLARMSNNEREQFVESLVNTYPNLAETVMSNIGFALMDKDISDEDQS
jgi:hypothetical protein